MVVKSGFMQCVIRYHISILRYMSMLLFVKFIMFPVTCAEISFLFE